MTTSNNIFKNNSGQYYLNQLFYEMTPTSDKSLVLYTLKREEHLGFPSLYQLYMSEDDPSEYLVATKYFDGWAHWKRLTECAWFAEHLRDWREELQVRQMAQSLNHIKQKALTGDVGTNKYLLEQGWIPKKDQVGRPSKEKIKSEAERLFKNKSEVSEDFERITN